MLVYREYDSWYFACNVGRGGGGGGGGSTKLHK